MRSRWPASAALCAILVVLASCGGTSLNPTPTVSATFPSTVPATLIGAPACTSNPTFTISVQGNNFLTNSVAYWNGAARKTTFNDSTGQLTVTILACDIASPGVAYVSVTNPPPGGGPSPVAVTFQITQPTNPAPSISSLSPASTAAGTLPPGGILTINGASAASGSNSPAFISSSQASINGNARATTFVSATELQVQMLASDVATAGTLTVSVTNPQPGGGVSSAPFTVTDPPDGANFPQVVSVSATGGAANGMSSSPAMSATGRYVAFVSTATNLVPVGKAGNVFVRDTCLGVAHCFPVTYPVDIAQNSDPPNGATFGGVSISSDGRFVAFTSSATNLTSTNSLNSGTSFYNVFVRDTCLGTNAPKSCRPHTIPISVDAEGTLGSGDSDSPSISVDGRFVAFRSSARGLAEDNSGRQENIFVRDTCEGPAVSEYCVPRTIAVPNPVLDGEPANATWFRPFISADGRYVVFDGTNKLTHVVTNGLGDVFIGDMCLGDDAPATCVPQTTLITEHLPGWKYGNGRSASISEDGRFVVFTADEYLGYDNELLPSQIVIHDTCLGASASAACVPTTALVSADTDDNPANAQSMSPQISPSGRFVTFTSGATNLDPTAMNGATHAYLRDTCFGKQIGCTPSTISVAPSGSQAIDADFLIVPVSADGTFAAFYSIHASASLPASGLGDVFLTLTHPQTQP